MKCDHCGSRIEGNEPFKYAGHDFCCGCMSVLCSWFLDDGQRREPEMFEYLDAFAHQDVRSAYDDPPTMLDSSEIVRLQHG
jgi:hypothetical protein